MFSAVRGVDFCITCCEFSITCIPSRKKKKVTTKYLHVNVFYVEVHVRPKKVLIENDVPHTRIINHQAAEFL